MKGEILPLTSPICEVSCASQHLTSEAIAMQKCALKSRMPEVKSMMDDDHDIAVMDLMKRMPGEESMLGDEDEDDNTDMESMEEKALNGGAPAVARLNMRKK
uniref:DUF305 domain-containing protein n=1 Tax=Mesocestoides corti TaxID=53468 RepID=A0A5K3FAX0_MESCO